MNWLDWLFILIIALSTIKGLKNGLLFGISGIISLLSGLWLAFRYNQDLASYLSGEWGWGEKISGYLAVRMDEQGLFFTDSIEGLANTLFLPDNITDYSLQFVSSTSELILNVISFLIILIIAYLVLSRIFKMISRTVSTTFLSPFDKLGGLFLGFVKGILVVVLIVLTISTLSIPFFFVLNESSEPGFITLAWENSKIIPLLYNLAELSDIFFRF